MATWQHVANILGKYYLFFVVVVANIVAFTAGASLSWSSPIIPKLQDKSLDDNPLGHIVGSTEISFIGSLPAIGGIFGPSLFGYTNDKWGRKFTTIALALPFLISFSCLTFGKVIELYYFARVISGIGLGGVYAMVPVYVAELSDNRNRGTLTSLTTTVIMCGLLYSYCVGPYTSIFTFNLSLALISLVSIPVIYLVCPESPYFLIQTDTEKAQKTLEKIRSTPKIQREMDDIIDSVYKEVKGSILDIFKTAGSRKAFAIVLTLLIFQQFSGINVILTYSQSIFDKVGSSLSSSVSAIIVGIVQLFSSFVTPIASRRVGRRPLLIIASVGTFVFQTALGTYYYFESHNKDLIKGLNWFPVVSLVFYIVFFNFGFGSLPWVIMGELYALNVKAVGASLTTGIYWAFGFLLTYFFNDFTDKLGMGPTFWIFGACCFANTFFVYFCLLETKGKSFNEIQAVLNS